MTRSIREIRSIGLAACLCAAVACGGGRPITVERSVQPFHSIAVVGPLRIAVEQGATAVRLIGDGAAARGAAVEVQGGVLVIEPAEEGAGDSMIEARVRTPDLRRISVTGAADVELDLGEATRERLELVVSGAGRVSLRGVDAGWLGVEVAGAADVEILGRAGRLEIAGHGAGVLDLGELCTETADVTLRGAGRATVIATTRIDARMEGAGLLRYFAPHELPAPAGGGEVKRLPNAGSCGR